MNKNNTKFDLNDFTIIPAVLTDIRSRKEINPFTKEGKLPIITAPMTSVISEENWTQFLFADIFPCLPRGQYVNSNMIINSISLEEFELLIAKIKSNIEIPKYKYLLIDIANGHLSHLYNLVKEFTSLNTEIKLIIGNIANPMTFKKYAELGIWGVRCSVGSGGACLTAVQTGIFYPLGSLISQCYEIKKENKFDTKIIADGGMTCYSDIIKSLALGADYVMVGGLLNKCLESSGDTKILRFNINKYKSFFWQFKFLRKYITKSYYGMSTKRAQKEWNKKEIKTSEGIEKTHKVEYDIEGWTENFVSYLRSAMSYTNSKNLNEFKDCEKIIISLNSYKRFLK